MAVSQAGIEEFEDPAYEQRSTFSPPNPVTVPDFVAPVPPRLAKVVSNLAEDAIEFQWTASNEPGRRTGGWRPTTAIRGRPPRWSSSPRGRSWKTAASTPG